MVLLAQAHQRLVALGYVIPLPDAPNAPNANWFIVTDAERQWASGVDPVPEDQTGLLRTPDQIVPALDSVIRQYVQEALVAYNRQAFFAAAVMIGAASETTVYMLIDALLAAVTNQRDRKAIQDAMDRRRLFTMLDMIRAQLQRVRESGAMPFGVHEGAEAHLMSLQEAIRVQRNEAVHPQACTVTPVTVRLALSAFPSACKKVYDLVDWLRADTIPVGARSDARTDASQS